jgi:hypothetical protein
VKIKKIVTSYHHREAARARLMAVHIQYHDYLVEQIAYMAHSQDDTSTVH